jgi:hypothetical protein
MKPKLPSDRFCAVQNWIMNRLEHNQRGVLSLYDILQSDGWQTAYGETWPKNWKDDPTLVAWCKHRIAHPFSLTFGRGANSCISLKVCSFFNTTDKQVEVASVAFTTFY